MSVALICGGRAFSDHRWMREVLDAAVSRFGITSIVHGGQKTWCRVRSAYIGADHLAGLWAKQAGLHVTAYPADWRRDGVAAGPIRNARMLQVGQPNLAVAFPGGRGTADMTARALAAGIPVYRVEPKAGLVLIGETP